MINLAGFYAIMGFCFSLAGWGLGKSRKNYLWKKKFSLTSQLFKNIPYLVIGLIFSSLILLILQNGECYRDGVVAFCPGGWESKVNFLILYITSSLSFIIGFIFSLK